MSNAGDPGDATSWRALLDDDEQAPRWLETALDRVTPVPEWVGAGAGRAWALRRVDAELAELVSTMSAAAAGARDDGDAQLLVFATSGFRLELFVRGDDRGTSVDGILERVAADSEEDLPVVARWECADGSTGSAPIDAYGAFFIEVPNQRRIRVLVETGPDGIRVVTDWFRAH